jgi:prephenate dehydratase
MHRTQVQLHIIGEHSYPYLYPTPTPTPTPRYNLHIIGEHSFRVRHSLMALPGTKMADITRVMSHPQALAQCDGYIR